MTQLFLWCSLNTKDTHLSLLSYPPPTSQSFNYTKERKMQDKTKTVEITLT